MDEFAHLIQAPPKYKDRDWKAFHSHFGDAALNRAGGRLVRDLVDAGFTIAYTTTRLDTFMQTTDYWLRQKSLPPGHIECRDFWTDGTVRPSLDIKRRHWWKWVDKYEDQSPVVAWIDDGPEAVAMLAEQGCPVWKFDQLVVEHLAGNLLPTIERGPPAPPADELAPTARRSPPPHIRRGRSGAPAQAQEMAAGTRSPNEAAAEGTPPTTRPVVTGRRRAVVSLTPPSASRTPSRC